jgi:hypothetical protein
MCIFLIDSNPAIISLYFKTSDSEVEDLNEFRLQRNTNLKSLPRSVLTDRGTRFFKNPLDSGIAFIISECLIALITVPEIKFTNFVTL